MTNEPRLVTIKPRMFDDPEPIVVELRPLTGYRAGESEVYLDGELLGTVHKYTGSLDRKVGRLRWPGKQRTLWSATEVSTSDDPRPRPWNELYSRADGIRYLIQRRDWRRSS